MSEKVVDFSEELNRKNGDVTFKVLQESLQRAIDSGQLTNVVLILETKADANSTRIDVGWNSGINGFEAVGILEAAKLQQLLRFKGFDV